MIEMPRGIHKINELVLQKNRALIMTEEDASKYNWGDIPYGTIKINTTTGLMFVKLKGALLTKDNRVLDNAEVRNDGKVYRQDGKPHINPKTQQQYTKEDVAITSETDWLPAGIKNDGTLCISRDAIIETEVFTISSKLNKDRGGNTFSYTNENNEMRHMPLHEGKFVFELEKGSYAVGRNHLEVFIDDILRRDTVSGGVEELTDRRFVLSDILEVGQEVTVKYIKIMRIGNPYPRIFMMDNQPEDSENGDLWIDKNATLEDDDILGLNSDDTDNLKTIPWDRITGKPSSINGYGIRDNLEYKGHTHMMEDIVNMSFEFRANGGNADTVGHKKPGKDAGNLLVLNEHGKIDSSYLPPPENVSLSSISGLSIGTVPPSGNNNFDIWFDTSERLIKYRSNGKWVPFGATYL